MSYVASSSMDRVSTVPVRILFLNLNTEVAGGELSLLSLLQRLDRTKYEVHVNINGSGLFEKCVRRIGNLHMLYTRIPIALRLLAQPRGIMRTLQQVVLLHAYARKHQIDIVHVSHANTLVIGAILRSFLGIKLVYHHRSYDENKLWLLRWLGRHFCDKVIAISEDMRKQFIGDQLYLADKVIRIYNGVDLSLFQPSACKKDDKRIAAISPDYYAIGIVGRLAPHKGQMLLLHAAEILLNKSSGSETDYAFYIIGDVFAGDTDPQLFRYKNELFAFVETHDLKPFVHFLGYRQDVRNIIKALDVLVAPSTREPFGRVVVEGMACGLPVIVARGSGGPEEIVQNGESGIVLRENTPEYLAEAIRELKGNPQFARKIGQAAKQRAQEFSVEWYIRSVERVYEDLTSQHR